MEFFDTDITNVKLIKPKIMADERGSFQRGYCAETFATEGLCVDWVQTNVAHTLKKGTVRGIHFQRIPFSEVKLVRCLRGAVFDVAVDLDPTSETYLQYVGVELSAHNGHSLYVPDTCAHGYQALTDDALIHYQVSTAYTPEAESGIRPADPALAIQWPEPISNLSNKDQTWPLINSE